MAYTLFTASLDLSRIVQKTLESTATAGSTTTLSDSTLIGVYPANHFNLGTIWVTSGTNVGTSRVITDFDDTLGKFTFAAMTGSVSNGDTYAAAPPKIHRYKLWSALNDAQGDLVLTEAEDATLQTVENQEEYALPTGVSNVLGVQVKIDSSFYRDHYHWEENLASGKLRFDTGFYPNAGYYLRLRYATRPSKITTEAGAFDRRVALHPEPVLWHAAVIALRDRQKIVEGMDPLLTNQLNEAITKAKEYLSKYPIPIPQRTPHLGRY